MDRTDRVTHGISVICMAMVVALVWATWRSAPTEAQVPPARTIAPTIRWPWPTELSSQARLVAYEQDRNPQFERFIFQEPDGTVKLLLIGGGNDTPIGLMRTYTMAPSAR